MNRGFISHIPLFAISFPQGLKAFLYGLSRFLNAAYEMDLPSTDRISRVYKEDPGLLKDLSNVSTARRGGKEKMARLGGQSDDHNFPSDSMSPEPPPFTGLVQVAMPGWDGKGYVDNIWRRARRPSQPATQDRVSPEL